MTDIIAYDSDRSSEHIWANDLVKHEEVNFQGWVCGIGLESIEIRSDGHIYRGTCRVGGKIGHVDDDVWLLPTEFVTCDRSECTCVADIKSTRYKTSNEREKLSTQVKDAIVSRNGNENSTNF